MRQQTATGLLIEDDGEGDGRTREINNVDLGNLGRECSVDLYFFGISERNFGKFCYNFFWEWIFGVV